jgi:hypothetical protein
VRHFLAPLALACALLCPDARADSSFTEGFVTRIAPSGDFDVNGMHVLVNAKTSITVKSWAETSKGGRSVSTEQATLPALFLGESVEIVGDVIHKSTEIRAKRIVLSSATVARVSGVGLIDLMPANSAPAEGKLIRADGYIMLVPAAADVTFAPPLKSFDDIHTNQWVRYLGVQRPDGVVVLDQADFSPNTINHREDKLRVRGEYDPSVIDEGDAQSGASKFFRGKDIKRLPAWHDAAMQARVDRVGKSLIPAFQKALREDDPTRIDFRFQVIDEPKHGDAWSFASGIILVPHQLVERLPDDSQLAAVLADSIAEVLEKQDLRAIPAKQKMTAASYAGDAIGIFVPGASLVPFVANHAAARSLLDHERQQSGRVSLCLMHDAGYDLTAATKAWWMLAAKPGSDSLPKRMPDHTLFLYEELGTTWHGEDTTKGPSGSGSTSAP